MLVLRSMHTCGFNTFFRPHSLDRVEEKLPKKEGVVHPSSTLWLHPRECVYVCMLVSVCVDVMYLYVSGLCVCV